MNCNAADLLYIHILFTYAQIGLQNYQQITSDIVNMAEKMNLDLHVKDELIKV